jgi:hypothetical protein
MNEADTGRFEPGQDLLGLLDGGGGCGPAVRHNRLGVALEIDDPGSSVSARRDDPA